MFNVKTHYKWPLLIAMFVYQRVNVVFFGIKLVETQRRIPWKSDSSDSWETKDVFMDSEHSISNLKIANAFFFAMKTTQIKTLVHSHTLHMFHGFSACF